MINSFKLTCSIRFYSALFLSSLVLGGLVLPSALWANFNFSPRPLLSFQKLIPSDFKETLTAHEEEVLSQILDKIIVLNDRYLPGVPVKISAKPLTSLMAVLSNSHLQVVLDPDFLYLSQRLQEKGIDVTTADRCALQLQAFLLQYALLQEEFKNKPNVLLRNLIKRWADAEELSALREAFQVMYMTYLLIPDAPGSFDGMHVTGSVDIIQLIDAYTQGSLRFEETVVRYVKQRRKLGKPLL